ncbi:MAG TPA: hypothetical protein VGE21_02650 [Flavobacteriales bacterium]
MQQHIEKVRSTDDFITNAVAGATTFNSPTIVFKENVKAGTLVEVPVYSNQLKLRAGNNVKTSSGGTTISTIQLGTSLFTHFDIMTGQDLSDRFPQILHAGATSEIDMPEAILANYTVLVQNAVSEAVWQGGYNGYAGDVTIDGWLKQLVNTSHSAKTYNQSVAYAFSAQNAVSLVNTFLQSRPNRLYTAPIELRMSPQAFESLKLGYIQEKSYFHDPTLDPWKMNINGISNCVAVADTGLVGAKAMVAITTNTLYAAADLKSDQNEIKFGYDDKLNESWMRICLSIGCKVALPEDIGVFRFA